MSSLPEDNDPCLGEGMLLGMELCRDVLWRPEEGLSGFLSDFLWLWVLTASGEYKYTVHYTCK